MTTTLTRTKSEKLTKTEKKRLSVLETSIDEGIKEVEIGFMRIGSALKHIQEERLYREHYSTFEQYCKVRGMSRSRAYRLIRAAEVVGNLSPIGDILPTSEAQARPLTQLPPEEQPAAWREAIEESGGMAPTAKMVSNVVNRKLEQPDSTKANPPKKGDMVRMTSGQSKGVVVQLNYAKDVAQVNWYDGGITWVLCDYLVVLEQTHLTEDELEDLYPTTEPEPEPEPEAAIAEVVEDSDDIDISAQDLLKLSQDMVELAWGRLHKLGFSQHDRLLALSDTLEELITDEITDWVADYRESEG